MKFWQKASCFCYVLGLLFLMIRGEAQARTEENMISADSAPYRIEWNGSKGVFLRKALALEKESRIPLTFLHTDAGPKGHSKYLAWFLGRGDGEYVIAWCYLNESGRDFWCWLYRFPTNQLTTLRFKGEYHFEPPDEPLSPTYESKFRLRVAPNYTGPDFAYRNWTRREGTLKELVLKPATWKVQESKPSAKTVFGLKVTPLHDVAVGENNGWREGGWRELHAIAYDQERDPYYLILYSNASTGFAIDMARGLTYTADFGDKVFFGKEATVFGKPEEHEPELPESGVRKNEVFEISLTTAQTYQNPATDVIVDAEVKTPDGLKWTVPGYWDGGGTWRVRVAPNRVGMWTYRIRSNDSEMHNAVGGFECAPSENDSRGSLRIHPSYQRHFAFSDGTPFFPVYLQTSVFNAMPRYLKKAGNETRLTKQEDKEESLIKLPESFMHFKQWAQYSAEAGVNRLTGAYLLGDASMKNEGGEAFVGGDVDHLNPKFFQWLDKRIIALNALGMVPDIGLGKSATQTFERYSDAQLRRLWRYLMARYSSYSICWNLFGDSIGELSPQTRERIREIAKLTLLYDPYKHPLTTLVEDNSLFDNKNNALTPKTRPSSAAVVGEEDEPLVSKTPFAKEAWCNVLSFSPKTLLALAFNTRLEKPMVVYDKFPERSGISPLRRIWETRMRGGYWTDGSEGMANLDSVTMQWNLLCARFFRTTRFWRLEPHGELITDSAEERRRKRFDPTSPSKEEKKTEAFLLADPAWEYVLYLPKGGSVNLDLLEATGTLKALWLDPRTGKTTPIEGLKGGAYLAFMAPDNQDWILSISRR